MFSEMIQSIRGIRRSPGFALLAIVTLALGIGISTAVFSVVNCGAAAAAAVSATRSDHQPSTAKAARPA